MSQIPFIRLKDISWVEPALKELGRDAKRPETSKPANPQKQITILYQEANYFDSLEILKENSLRPLTYQEALAHSADLIEKLQGKKFWLAGDGKDLKISGREIKQDATYSFDKQGNLAKPRRNETWDQKVLIYLGRYPLIFFFSIPLPNNTKFGICADNPPAILAPAVVGIREEATFQTSKSDTGLLLPKKV